MEPLRMFQDVLLAEYHGTLYDTPTTRCMILMLNLPNKFG
jgi:hypothetical protein